MQLIPKYTVSYKGVFRRAKVAFDIDPRDEAEMKKHGDIVEPPPRRPGRPRKDAGNDDAGAIETANTGA